MANSTHDKTKEDTSGLWQQSHRDWSIWRAWSYLALLTCISGGGLLLAGDSAASNYFGDVLNGSWKADPQPPQKIQVIREYDLQIGVRWMNPDGGRWRVMYVCNGQSPCPTLLAEEGDIVKIAVHSDSYFQSSIHWAGVGYTHTGAWNDGTAGVSQFPTMPRGNNTIIHDTTGAWGLNWYADHTSAASVDGLYGMIYVAPSSDRLRPYSLLTNDSSELRQIMDAERSIRHMVVKNHMHRDTNWKLQRMRAEGSEFHCYNSILVNGKGRNICRLDGYERLNDLELDPNGCLQPRGLPAEPCTPSEADFEVIETNGLRYIMLNLVNTGFEHEVQISVDKHKIALVANDGGFIHPEVADVVYIPSAARVTILIKLDQEPADYAMRIVSTSQLQNLVGFSILRYPARRAPVYGEPMKLPSADSENVCVRPDGLIKDYCKGIDPQRSRPFPAQPPPISSATRLSQSIPAEADYTFRLSADSQKSATEKHAPEYLLNEKPWPLFRGSMKPLLFTNSSNESERNMLEKPVIHGLPLGSVVDLIIENKLNDSIPLYKHGVPAWLLGASAFGSFGHASVKEAVQSNQAGSATGKQLNLVDPALVVVHNLPPLGWSVLRFKVTSQSATMLHAVKIRYFVLGMSVPILEGVTLDTPISVPDAATQRPHIDFDPKNDGIFG